MTIRRRSGILDLVTGASSFITGFVPAPRTGTVPRPIPVTGTRMTIMVGHRFKSVILKCRLSNAGAVRRWFRSIPAVAALMAGILIPGHLIASPPAARVETNQTIVMLRHGEKPHDGLGQLNCQGLNRALALPPVIRKAFGRPAAIFAPNPSEQKIDFGKLYDYVRPLATIEPTAIAFGLPINSGIGQSRVAALRRRLDAPEFHDAFALVAWEHNEIPRLARALMKAHGGDPGVVPEWNGRDFDSIYVIRIKRTGPDAVASFELTHEGLDGQPVACPGELK